MPLKFAESTLMRYGGIALIAFLVGMAFVYFTPLKYSQIVEPKIRDINPTVIAERMQADPNAYDFIDVRGPSDYANLHAEGARNLPLYRMYFERHNLPKHGKTIVLICSGGVASGVAFSYLEHFGFRNIVRVDGGIETWQASGLPTRVGD